MSVSTVRSRIAGTSERRKMKGTVRMEQMEMHLVILKRMRKNRKPTTKRIGETKKTKPAMLETAFPPWK